MDEITWTRFIILSDIMAKNKTQAAKNAKKEITNQANSSSSQTPQYITTTGKPSGVLHRYYDNKNYTKTWLNLCMSSTCKGKKYGTLTFNPKGTAEGEITCSACNSDYDCVSGADKMSPPRFFLKDVNGNSNSNSNVDVTIGDTPAPGTDANMNTTTTSSAEGSYQGYSPLLSGEQSFQQLVAEVTNGINILVLCKRNIIKVTDFETLYAEAKVLRDNKSYVDEDIHLWQLEDGTYSLDVNEYGFFNTVNVVYNGGVITETYEDLVRVYGVMAKTYYDKKLTKSQAQAKAKAYLAAHIQEFGMEIKCSILHNPAIEVGDIVTLENPLTLRDAVKKVSKGLPEYLFVRDMSISWEDGGPIKNDLVLSYSPEAPERDADTSTTAKTTTDTTSSGTQSSDQTGSGSSTTTSTTTASSEEESKGKVNIWTEISKVVLNHVEVTKGKRNGYIHRLYLADTKWANIAKVIQGHNITGGSPWTKDLVIRTIYYIKKDKITSNEAFNKALKHETTSHPTSLKGH